MDEKTKESISVWVVACGLAFTVLLSCGIGVIFGAGAGLLTAAALVGFFILLMVGALRNAAKESDGEDIG